MHYTFQIWDIRTHKLKMDLPGHADEVSRCFDKIELVINNIVVLLITEYKERTETMMHVMIIRCTPLIGVRTVKRWRLVARIGSSSYG